MGCRTSLLDGFKDLNIRLAKAGIVFYLFLFGILSVFGQWLPPLTLQFPGYELIDAGFFFGFLQRGIITAPAFVLLLLFQRYRATAPILKWIVSAIVALIYVYLALSPSAIIEYLYSLLIIIIATLIYYTFTNSINKMETVVGISVSSFWIVICFGGLLLPIFFATGLLPTIYLSLLIGYFMCFHRKLARSALVLQSIRITDNKTLSSEPVQSAKYMQGDTGNLPHIIGLIFSCTLFLSLEQIVDNSKFVTLIALFSYLIVMTLFIFRILITRFNVDSFVEGLSNSGLIVIDLKKHVKADATQVFLKARINLIIFEVSSQIMLVLVALFLLRGYDIPTTNIPLVFVTVAVSKLFSVFTLDVIKYLAKIFYRNRVFSTDSFEFSAVMKVSDKKKETTWSKKLKRLLNPFTSIRKFIIFLWMLLVIITTLVNAADAFSRIMEFFKNISN